MDKKESKEKIIRLSEIQADTLDEGARMAEQLSGQLKSQQATNDKLLSLILDANDLKLSDIEQGSIRFLPEKKSLLFNPKIKIMKVEDDPKPKEGEEPEVETNSVPDEDPGTPPPIP